MGCCTSVNTANPNAVKKINKPDYTDTSQVKMEVKKSDPKLLEEIIKKKRTEGPPPLQPLGHNALFQQRKEQFRRKSLLEDPASTKLNTPQENKSGRKRYGSVLVPHQNY